MRVLLVGGTSEIGLAVVRALTGRPGGAGGPDDPRDPPWGGPAAASVVLAGRPGPDLDAAGDHLARTGPRVVTIDYDASWDTARTTAMLDDAELAGGGAPDVVVVAVGAMGPAAGPGEVAEPDLERLLRTNLTGPALVANEAAGRLRRAGRGELVVLTSAAAVRPRDRILGYAVAKQALDSFVRGLDRRSRKYGVRCRVVRPGQVRTRMTAGLPEAPLTTDPDEVGHRVRTALRGRTAVVWSPPAMRAVVTALRLAPARALPEDLR